MKIPWGADAWQRAMAKKEIWADYEAGVINEETRNLEVLEIDIDAYSSLFDIINDEELSTPYRLRPIYKVMAMSDYEEFMEIVKKMENQESEMSFVDSNVEDDTYSEEALLKELEDL